MKKTLLLLSVFICTLGDISCSGKTGKVFVVTSLKDDLITPNTLRWAIMESNKSSGHDTILIKAVGIDTMRSGFPMLTDPKGVTIIGPGSQFFSIDARFAVIMNPQSGEVRARPETYCILRFHNSNHNTISGISLINVPSVGIMIDTSGHNKFTDISISGLGFDNDAALMEFVTCNYDTVTDCLFMRGGLGLRFGWSSNHNIFSNSRSLFNNHSNATMYGGNYNQFTQLDLEHSENCGMYIIAGASNCWIENNLVLNNMQAGIIVQGDADHKICQDTIRNNRVFGNGTFTSYQNIQSGGNIGPGNLIVWQK